TGRAEPSGHQDDGIARVGLFQIKKSLELLGEMNECIKILHGSNQYITFSTD
ncbi:MAG: hypothetical protein JG776_431, partial [Caloramator sp.]|nr:hypothetical protein [Caloramator sp.]